MSVGESAPTAETQQGWYRWFYLPMLVALVAALWLLGQLNFLLFHGLVECFRICVSAAILTVAWNARRYAQDGLFLSLGIGFGCVGALDTLHVFAYRGMGVFPKAHDGDLATQLWVASRYVEALTLLATALWRSRQRLVALLLSGLTVVLLLSIFVFDLFPSCFTVSAGLTTFKKVSELVVVFVHIVAFALFWRLRGTLPTSAFRPLLAAIALSGAAEITFTLYVSVFGASAILGHLLKFAAFVLIYRGLVVASLQQPYDLLFRGLQLSEQRLRALFDRHHAPMLQIDPVVGRILDANDAAARFYGWEREELRQKTIQEINQLSPKEVDAEMARAAAEQRNHFVFPHRRADGEVRIVEVHSTPIESAGGTVLFSIVHDVTAKDRAERALQAEHELLVKVAASYPSYVSLIESDFTAGFTSGRAFARRGLDPSSFVGLSLEQVFGEQADTVRAHYERAFDGEEVVFDLVVGEEHQHYTVVPIEEDGQVRRILAVVEDRSRLYALEEQLRQSQKMEAIGTLAGGIAHDFNNILAAIMGHAELALEESDVAETVQTDLQQILSASKRAKDLVQQILLFSRKETGLLRPLEIHGVVQEAVKLLRGTIPATVSIQEEIDESCGVVEADATQLVQVVVNLATNAHHAMRPKGGCLTVRLHREDLEAARSETLVGLAPGPHVVLEVCDTGSGIEATELQRIFEPFYTSKAPGQGTGMGLAVVHGIVSAHGGAIEVDSQLGVGSTFRVWLPSHAEGAAGAMVSGPLVAATASERILVVDDEPAVRSVMKRMLEQLGHEVTALASPEEVLTAFRRAPESFTLLVTDQTMPGLTGMGLVRALRELRPGLPVVLCTGFSEDVDEAAAEQLAVVLLHKPVSKKALASALQQALTLPQG